MPEVMLLFRWVSIFAALLGTSCAGPLSLSGSAQAETAQDFLGQRFLCDEPSEKQICVSFLEPSCDLAIIQGEGIPNEPWDKLILRRAGASTVVHEPSDIAGCVSIKDGLQALEYTRLFSSIKTVHLFSEPILEIYPKDGGGCYLVCLPRDVWESLGLSSPVVEPSVSGFLVTRHVIKAAPPGGRSVKVFKLTQMVTSDGRVYEVSSTTIDMPEEHLLWLGFPGYL